MSILKLKIWGENRLNYFLKGTLSEKTHELFVIFWWSKLFFKPILRANSWSVLIDGAAVGAFLNFFIDFIFTVFLRFFTVFLRFLYYYYYLFIYLIIIIIIIVYIIKENAPTLQLLGYCQQKKQKKNTTVHHEIVE